MGEGYLRWTVRGGAREQVRERFTEGWVKGKRIGHCDIGRIQRMKIIKRLIYPKRLQFANWKTTIFNWYLMVKIMVNQALPSYLS